MLSHRLVGPSPPSATNSTRGFSSRVVFRHPNDLSSFSSLQGVLAQCRNRLLSAAFFRSHVEPGTNSTCPAFFSRECTDTGSTYPERFVELGGVDVLGWTAHASWPTRAAVHAGKVLEGVAAEEHYWVLWPPCRWSKNETRGWWPGGGGKMVCRKDTQLMRENVSETDVASACVRCCVS